MRKLFFVVLMSFVFFNSRAYAIDTKLFDLRNRIFDESKELKALLSGSKDVVILASMFNSCLIATLQIDAYFHMLGIFESIKEKDLTAAPFEFILSWLDQIKSFNNLNLKNLTSPAEATVPTTQAHIEKLKEYFVEFNSGIKTEIDTILMLKKSSKIKRER
jgi:hypothetical protein